MAVHTLCLKIWYQIKSEVCQFSLLTKGEPLIFSRRMKQDLVCEEWFQYGHSLDQPHLFSCFSSHGGVHFFQPFHSINIYFISTACVPDASTTMSLYCSVGAKQLAQINDKHESQVGSEHGVNSQVVNIFVSAQRGRMGREWAGLTHVNKQASLLTPALGGEGPWDPGRRMKRWTLK